MSISRSRGCPPAWNSTPNASAIATPPGNSATTDGTTCRKVSASIVWPRKKKEERWKEEIEIALQIAFGHHGLGELFTSENPFVLTAIAANAEGLEEIKSKLFEIKHEYGDRVVIDGFVMPK